LKGLATVLAKIRVGRIRFSAEWAGFYIGHWQPSGFSPAKMWMRQPGPHVLSDLIASQ